MTVSSKHQRQLDEEGYVVIPEVLSVAEIASYRARLLELAAAERADGSGRVHSEGRGQHVRWLVNKGREFERLVAHPMVVPYFEHLQGPDYTLSTLTSNLIYPGAADHPFHIDNALSAMPEPLPSFPMFVNSLWLLDDFTPENGSTRFVPGSHRWLQKPPPAGARPSRRGASASAGGVGFSVQWRDLARDGVE
jgi:ectoine hydroxylase-related dioxygenase (phytanoyl-CoA dioxygenase family)